ncbi:MAG: undecaprenyl-diphosphate phosphatase [Candidatus Pacebacteria bacterium]|nr:undecaprenyl-diphosphate phosphatase [Candidatus Paceibacterota bacterium]
MEIIQSIILGIIQGITEFLPISSSGHLILIPRIFGWEDQGLAFDVALHWGTLIAVLIYFRKDWVEIIRNSYLLKLSLRGSRNDRSNPVTMHDEFNSGIASSLCGAPRNDILSFHNFKKYLKSDLLFIIIIATIPGVIAGLLLNNYAETVFRNPLIISATLFLGAILLFYADKVSIKKADLTNLTLRMGIIVGLFQALAIIPGVSRSGITITIALLLGLKRTSAAKFSFLLSTPIILGAGIKEFPSLLESGLDVTILVGVLISALSGYLAIKYMLRYLENRNYDVFVGYRILLAITLFSHLSFSLT